MVTVPSTPLHAALVALSAAGIDNGAAGHTLWIDPSLSGVRWEIESKLGACAFGPHAKGKLEGTLEFALRPGPFPACSAEERGSYCFCRPEPRGKPDARASELPPLLEAGVEALVLSMRSPAFEVESNGSFEAPLECAIEAGTLALSLLGGAPIVLSVGGAVAQTGRSRGQVWIDATGLHLLRQVDLEFPLDGPASDLGLCLRLRGLLRGDRTLPAGRPLAMSNSCFQLGYREPAAEGDFVR